VLKELETELQTISLLSGEYLFDYLLEQGQTLPSLPDELKIYSNEVQGCQSRVWMVAEDTNGIWNFAIDSDAYIVKGISKLISLACNGATTEEVLSIKFSDFHSIAKFLTTQRQQGLQAMINRVHSLVH
jgi:cysteine desulfuration protein SufE